MNIEKDKFSIRFRQQGYLCQVRDQEFSKVLSSLQLEIQKYEENLKTLKEANANLEQARSEKQIADEAVQEIVRNNANVVPFSVPPTPSPRSSSASATQPSQTTFLASGFNPTLGQTTVSEVVFDTNSSLG